jgi:integrase
MKPVWWDFFQVSPDGWSSPIRSVDRLLKHLKRKGEKSSSRQTYIATLYRFCICHKITPGKLLELNIENLKDLVQEYCDRFLNSKNYANTTLYNLLTFFEVNNIHLVIKPYTANKRYRKRKEYIPSYKEALKMAKVAENLRDRCIILFIILCGLRNSTLRALTLSNDADPNPLFQDYSIKKELERGSSYILVKIHLGMKELIADACKSDIEYFTFIPPQVKEALIDYLEDRKWKRGRIFENEPLFIREDLLPSINDPKKLILSRQAVNELVKEAARLAGIKEWKYVTATSLRKVFDNFLIDHDPNKALEFEDREFMMGHLLPGASDRYFHKEKIEEMRSKYTKLDFNLQGEKRKVRKIINKDELRLYLGFEGFEMIVLSPETMVVSYFEENNSTESYFACTEEERAGKVNERARKILSEKQSDSFTNSIKKTKKLGQNHMTDFLN